MIRISYKLFKRNGEDYSRLLIVFLINLKRALKSYKRRELGDEKIIIIRGISFNSFKDCSVRHIMFAVIVACLGFPSSDYPQ